jgi:sugar phosphate permease
MVSGPPGERVAERDSTTLDGVRETLHPPSARVLPLLVFGYAAFYLCRANVEPALGLLAIEHGYDNEQVGVVLGLALGLYALGKLVLGPLADLWGGKRMLVGSLVATAALSLAIGVLDAPRRLGPARGLLVVGILVVANRFVQAGGWGGVIRIVGSTYSAARRGTVMGVVSTSYDIGNVVTLVLSSALVGLGGGWRTLFLVNPAIVLGMVAILHFALPRQRRTSPADALPTVTPLPTALGPTRDERFASVARRLLRQPSFWFAIGLSFLLTFVRAGFMTWTPRFLYEVSTAAGASSPMSDAIARTAFFGVAGIIGSVVCGRISDRLGPGRRAPLMTISLGLLLVSTIGLAHAGVASPIVATIGVASCGLFLLGPYSLLAGAVSLDVAGPRGAATAAGIVDAVGYVGASLAAVAIGSVSKRSGWTAAFDLVGGVTLAALVLALIWSLRRTPSPTESGALDEAVPGKA